MRRHNTSIWMVRSAALAVALMGGVSVLSAMTPSLRARLEILRTFLPLEVQYGGFLTATVSGFVLLALSFNLWRRKRIAWLLTIIALIVAGLSHLIKGLDFEEALVAFGLAGGLWRLRRQFVAQSDGPSVRRSLIILVGAIAFTLAYGTIGFLLLDRHIGVSYRLSDALRQTIAMVALFYDPGLEPITRFGRYFAWSIYAVGVITIGASFLLLMRPVLLRAPATADERTRASAIVACHGRTPLARYALLDDKSYVFTPGGSVVAFVVKNGIALALGDPIGPREDLPAAIDTFTEQCARHDWQPAWYQTNNDTTAAYRSAGFDLLCIGQEAIVDLRCFSLKGKSAQDWRSALNRFGKLGYRAEARTPPHNDELIIDLRSVSDAWLAQMHEREQRFSLGWFTEGYIHDSQALTVLAPDGTICAFATLVSTDQRRELGVDLMRYRPDAEKGIMDYLFITLIQWAQTQGYERFNLGLSALAGVGEAPSDPMIERILHAVYDHANRHYHFRGLHSFKEKFHPTWSPRYLAYTRSAQLPAVLGALTRAQAGDGILWDMIRGRF